MKTQLKSTLVIILLTIGALSLSQAQDFTGMATYKTASAMQINMEGDQVSAVNQEELQRQLSKSMQREYILSFNAYESSYKQAESLAGAPEAQSGNVVVRIAGGDNLIYRNTKEKVSKEKADLFGKLFLVEDEPEALDWSITNESKQIGKYECQKAIYIRIREQTEINSSNDDGPKITMDTVQVVAWFTSEIPVNHGPNDYWGLPGLILEVNDGQFTTICTKVTLNPKEEVSIEIPSAGKKVSREAFNTIREEKMKEMMNQYRGKDGQHRIIRIGG